MNGAGELAFMDTYIYLLRDDGDLTEDDKIARNDDSVTTLSSDVSIHGYDSFLITWTDDISLSQNPGVVVSTPEPGTLALLSLGLLCVGFSRRVKRDADRA